MKNQKLNTSIKISLLAVMGFLLMFIELPIPIFPAFLKIDISDLPALLGAFALGPVQGIAIELLKNVLHGIFKGGTAFVGELANFLVGGIMAATAGYVYKRDKSKKGAIKASFVGIITMAVGATILNYYVFLPLYEKVLGFPIKAVVGMGSKLNSNITDLNSFVVWAIFPFNLLKGAIVSIATMAVYKSVSPILHKENLKNSLEDKKAKEVIRS